MKKTTKPSRRRQDFIAAWLRSPLGTGALLPSSRMLAKEMAKQLDLKAPGVVVELGAGTGVVTLALLEAGFSPDRLLVVERDKKLHEILVSAFPGLKIVCGDAAQLDAILKQHNITQVSAIVSSLPLITLPKPVRAAIIAQMATLMHSGARVVQFTFGITSPINRSERTRYGIQGKHAKTVLANVPPAHVWVYRKGTAH